MKDEIAKRDQATSALLGVFPSSETVDEFVSDNIGRISLKGFIDYAAAYGIIESADEEAFYEFIRSNERKTEECIPPG